MEFPTKLKVLGVPFKVEVCPIEDDSTVGETYGLHRKIRISDTLDNRKKWSVLLHEWVHAVLHVNGAGSVLPEHVEEMIAQSMEHALEELMLQIGPQLLVAISEEEEQP